ncbi:MAG: CBS domain-containing protein [Methanosphaera sp.]|nr:CBS domain-containing protein [Methanosphaera sp.]
MELKTNNDIGIKEAMTRNVVTARSDTTITEIATIMTDNDISSVVIEDKEVEGIITTNNIISKVVSKNISPDHISAGMVMDKFIEITSNTTLVEASSIMIKNNSKVALVIDDGQLKGLLTLTDIVRVSPELIALFVEKSNIDEPYVDDTTHTIDYPDSLEEGVCERCGVYSQLSMKNNQYLCSDCIEDEDSQE